MIYGLKRMSILHWIEKNFMLITSINSNNNFRLHTQFRSHPRFANDYLKSMPHSQPIIGSTSKWI